MAQPPSAPKLAAVQNLTSAEERPIDREERTDPGLVLPKQSPAARPPAGQPAATPGASGAETPRMPDLGALNAYLRDPTVTEIIINDLRGVVIEREGKMAPAPQKIASATELNRLTRNIIDFTGRVLTAEMPFVDAMLPDGSRVHIVAPPLTVGGPCITIRKFPQRFDLADLIVQGALTQKMAQFLAASVAGRVNLLISGGTGSGKTTLLNSLLMVVPADERIVTIEETPELYLRHENSVKMQTKPAGPATPPITARDLVANALRMRPDRVIVGECRRGEAFDMLQAMNTGHEGSMTTIHANSPRDALSRLETLCLLAGTDLPVEAVRKQMVGAIDLIVHVRRYRDGRRRVAQISEVTGIESGVATLQDLFVYEAANKSGAGAFKATGLVPTFAEAMGDRGVELPKDFFAAA